MHDILQKLNVQYEMLEKVILSRQDPVTGLLPASTAINAHGDYTDAWVRDNVYSILAVWGLALAFKKHVSRDTRAYTLKQSVVKLMRGLLRSMMLQASRVEAYKKSHDPLDALHAKYATNSGLAVVADDAWGHLQLDATSLFVLMIAQMSASGIALIYTKDEVDFVQNLVHYIAKTYTTPDYGIWERGNKINHGKAEINCSSVGMAKAALEAISGFNLFIESDTDEGVIYVLANDIVHSRLTLQGLLPRESDSKESDAALLSIIGYPAYAVEDTALVLKTRNTIVEKLAGKYGCKRFLLDGHQSVLEDASRLHYEPSELREFADIESEWPLFFTYFLLDALMREDGDAVAEYKEKLSHLFVEKEGLALLPELYYVSKENIEAEKQKPHSQERVANENLPLVWAQSLYMLSDMVMNNLIDIADIDPLGRRKCLGKSVESTPRVCIIAQNESVQWQLGELGISSERFEELEDVVCMHASQLVKVYETLGANAKLGLSGRTIAIPRTLSTAKLYSFNSQKVLFFPYYFDPNSFYFEYDNNLFVEHFRASVRFLASSWGYEKEPIIPFLVREDMLRDHSKDVIIKLLQEVSSTACQKADIYFAKMSELMDSVETEQMPYVSVENLEVLDSKEASEHSQPYEKAALAHDWTQVRLIAQENKLFDIRVEDALMDILVAQKRLSVGRSYSEGSILDKPKEATEIMEAIESFCGQNRAEKALTQEIILHLGHLLRIEPQLFDGMLTLRTWDAIQLLVGHVSKEKSLGFAQAYEELLRYAPHGIYDTLRYIYKSYSKEIRSLKELENIRVSGLETTSIDSLETSRESIEVADWERWRDKAGRIGASSERFYRDVWHILQQCKGLVIGDKYSIQSRIGSELTLESTAGERSFELKVDTLMQSITIPSYKQLNIELIETLSELFSANPTLQIEDDLVLDVLIGHAVRILWMQENENSSYEEHKGEAWSSFYKHSAFAVKESFVAAFSFLMTEEASA